MHVGMYVRMEGGVGGWMDISVTCVHTYIVVCRCVGMCGHTYVCISS